MRMKLNLEITDQFLSFQILTDKKLIYKRIKSFFEENDVVFKSQFGFREKHSTQHAILDIVNNIQDNGDHKALFWDPYFS